MSGLASQLKGLGCEDFDECYGFREGDYMQADTEVILLSFPRDKADGVKEKVDKISWNIVYESIYGEAQALKIDPFA